MPSESSSSVPCFGDVTEGLRAIPKKSCVINILVLSRVVLVKLHRMLATMHTKYILFFTLINIAFFHFYECLSHTPGEPPITAEDVQAERLNFWFEGRHVLCLKLPTNVEGMLSET